ncbi:MAG: FtsH protease activity modulator HflK [Hyphomicrobiaceae bacterium]|nr:FtsH protease activity modulator HflK [Hyphomicrobiaceae bacterium]
MPWNNQNGGGGWKSGGGGGGGGGPWGQGPWGQNQGGGGQGGGQQPDLEEILKRGQDRMKQVMRGGGGGLPGWLTGLVVLGAIAAVAFFAFTFRVESYEKGVVLRFGQVNRTVEPGLHLRYPSPIEEVRKPEVQRQKKVEIGFRTLGSRGSVATRDVPEESLMLTGDENIVDIDFVVLWIIDNAENYLFKLQNPDETVRAVSESAMREVIGNSKVSDVLAPGREPIEIATKNLIQQNLNSYEAGVKIQEVKIQQGLPPAAVRGAFEDVIAALQDKSRAQNEAQAYANKIVPEARGEAERILQAAQAYKEQTVAEANGQAARFTKVYDEYKKAPEVTRKRMFLETMERVFNGTDKIILDKSGGGVVPYLPLGELGRNKTAGGK